MIEFSERDWIAYVVRGSQMRDRRTGAMLMRWPLRSVHTDKETGHFAWVPLHLINAVQDGYNASTAKALGYQAL